MDASYGLGEWCFPDLDLDPDEGTDLNLYPQQSSYTRKKEPKS